MGAPLFRKAVLRFENGKLFTIEAPENGPGNRYIRSASLNGEKYTKITLPTAICCGEVNCR